MQKLTHPISIFVLVLFGFILVFFKTELSPFFYVQTSFIFAIGVFLISFGFGLLFFVYLISGSESGAEVDVQKSEYKVVNGEVEKENNIQVTQKKQPREIEKKSSESKKNVIIEKTVKKNIAIDEQQQKEILDFRINKKNVQKEFTVLHHDLEVKKTEYEKGLLSSNLIMFFALVVLIFGVLFSYLNFDSLELPLKAGVSVLILILFLVIIKYQQSTKNIKQGIQSINRQLSNLEQITKRFNIISQQNSNALKSTIESLIPENKEYIYKKILTKK